MKEGSPKFDLRVSLHVGFQVSEKNGLTLVPMAHSSFLSPVDPLPNFRMFKALVEKDITAPAVAKELAASDGSIILTWEELGLSGIKSLLTLFWEFANGNEMVKDLGRREVIFDPEPFLGRQEPGDKIHVVKELQPALKEIWRKQLEAYRARLAV